MTNIKGTGVPTRKTQGAINDIYTDTTTGKQYQCVFAYLADSSKEYDCQWAELTSGVDAEPVKASEVESKPEVVTKKSTNAKKVKAEEEKPEEKKEPEQPKKTSSKRTDYRSYSKAE